MSNFLRWLNEHFTLLRKVATLKPLMADNTWPSIIVSNNAQLADLKLVFAEVKERVKESADEADKLYQKSVTFLGLSITILTASTCSAT